jgi:hemolysin activation/secretion protein
MFTGKRFPLWDGRVILCLSLLSGFAQERRVESVAVRGLRHISETAVIAALRLKPGEPFTEATLESDRRAIEAMGLFSAVRPRVEQTETGVRVEFEVVENPLIREVRFTGNTVLSAEQLLEVMRNKPGFVFNTNFAEPDIRAIRDAYQRAGYIVLPEGYTPPDYENGVLTIALSELRVGANPRRRQHQDAHECDSARNAHQARRPVQHHPLPTRHQPPL